MMKKILILMLSAWVAVGAVGAKKRTKQCANQTVVSTVDTAAGCLAWKAMPIETQDLRELLELKEMYVYKYDLSGVRDTSLRVMVQLDEYFGRDSMRTVRLMSFGKVFEGRRDEGQKYLTDLKFYFMPQSDSTMLVYCLLEGRMMSSFWLKMKKIAPDFKDYGSYSPKSFDTKELKVDQTVPVLLFGSSWYDAEISKYYRGMPIYRFCPENQLPEDMNSESFDRMPHYWVIRVGLQHRRE
jgi:hypothetical protein